MHNTGNVQNISEAQSLLKASVPNITYPVQNKTFKVKVDTHINSRENH